MWLAFGWGDAGCGSFSLLRFRARLLGTSMSPNPGGWAESKNFWQVLILKAKMLLLEARVLVLKAKMLLLEEKVLLLELPVLLLKAGVVLLRLREWGDYLLPALGCWVLALSSWKMLPEYFPANFLRSSSIAV